MNTEKEAFYSDEDHPTKTERAEIWNAVKKHLPGQESEPSPIHWMSFWMGQAAAIILVLALFGGWTLWNEISNPPKPASELQIAYTNTLREMASANLVLPTPLEEPRQEKLDSQLRGLEEVDRIIEEIRNDMLINGSTKAKRHQLRRLYATKLEFVQKMLLTEEESI